MTEQILKPFFLQSSRGNKDACEICYIKFQILLKQEHQCKRCLRSVCQKCGPKRIQTYMIDGSVELHRNCLICIKQVENIQYYQSSYKLCFGQDSSFLEQWLKKLNKQRKSNTDIMNQYIQMSNLSIQNTIRFKKESDQIFIQLLPSYNFSFRHFVRSLTKTYNKQKTNQKIKSVMLAVYGYLKELPYVPELIYLVIFLLCFSSEHNAYFLTSRLIEKVYPQYFRVKKMKKDNLLANQLKVILELYKFLTPKADKDQLQMVATYLQVRFSQYLVSFTLNIASITSSFIVLQQLFKTANYLTLYQGVTAMIYCCRQSIANYKSPAQIQLQLLKEVPLQTLKNALLKFQKNELKLQLSHQVFDSAQHRKLHQKYVQIQSLFKKSEQINQQKSKQIITLKEKINQQKSVIKQLNIKIQKYQEEILYFSLEIPQIQQLQTLRNQNSRLIRQIQEKQFQAEKYMNLYRQMERQRYVKNQDHQMLKILYEDYSKQIIQLRSYTQILQIKIAAKNIDFDTSIIDKKIQEKNKKIQQLTQKCRSLNIQLQYFKTKNNNSSAKKKSEHKNQGNSFQKQQMAASFKKKIQSTIQLTKNLKEKIQTLQNQLSKSRQKVILLETQYKKDIQIIQKNKKIEQIMGQISQEYEYQICVADLQKFVQKQLNFAKKSVLQNCSRALKKAISELRFKEIDIRMKQQKLAQISQKERILTNSSNKDSQKSSIRLLTNEVQQGISGQNQNQVKMDQIENYITLNKNSNNKQNHKDDDMISRKFTKFYESQIQQSQLQLQEQSEIKETVKNIRNSKNDECIIM